MSDNRWLRVEDIFHRAVDLARQARSAFLDEACGADQSLRQEVESLLAHESESGTTFAGPAGEGEPKTIAHYLISGKLGQGGMGAVYRATDTKLGREVAIKVLPLSFAEDSDRMARFTREAKVLASLNHPYIAQIYGLEDRALVMELVPGETLRGPLPLWTALNYAKQIAEALEAAHEKGIVHRDLKPANIAVTPEGVVKLLDFGLASIAPASAGNPLNSPTITMQSAPGVIMGTAAYMSPEQAAGKAVDKRADVWSFGAVLWELLMGRRLFEGETVSLTLAVVLRGPIDFAKLPRETPPAIRHLLRRCLDRDVKNRLRDIGEARIAIEKTLAGETPLLEGSPMSGARRLWLARGAAAVATVGLTIPWVVAAVMGVITVGALIYALRNTSTTAPETRLEIVTPATNFPSSFALSPDGRRIAYVTSSGGAHRLWVRSLDATSAQPLPGTEGALSPFWSPDGRSLGFFADQKLKRIDLGSEQALTLADALTSTAQGAWSEEGVILFSRTISTGLSRIPASGGPELAATKLSKGQVTHRAPRFLPGGRQFLFAVYGTESALWLGSLDGTEARPVSAFAPSAESPGEYLADGWLVRVRQNVLIAQRFDADRGQLSGDPAPLAQGVGIDPMTYAGAFSVSRSGMIAWRSSGGSRWQLTWFNRSGQNVGSFGVPTAADVRAGGPELSPDGSRVAISKGLFNSSDVWMQEETRTSRFTFDPGNNVDAIWSPDGTRVVFASSRNGPYDLYLQRADGAGSEEVLLQSPENKRPNSWSPDGRFILYSSSRNNGDLMVLPLTGDRKPFPFLSTQFSEQLGAFSPDGRWVAYQSDESGRDEIYVRAFPGPAVQWQISVRGGRSPRWRVDGKELYYLTPDDKLMAVPITRSATFASGTAEALFQTQIAGGVPKQQYDVARDGRFLINTELQGASNEPIHLLLNWKPPAR
jgi:eukaryotic-like serine/threonine-protein kinase